MRHLSSGIAAGCGRKVEAMIMKDPCTYSMRILRQEQILRDHGGALGAAM
jgi:hypothetical protein